ncbi:multidrug ABC transporter substrate-binding protein [Liberibacter crescens]|nr:multidrug ABC transporter substrate-binding protein [Liberibacter crescens]
MGIEKKISITGPFSKFEWMIAWRYLRSNRNTKFISVIAGFSFLGVMLGVATLIIVMSVMNGFRSDIISRILGINGHIIVQPIDTAFKDYDSFSKKLSSIQGIKLAIPLVEGQVFASGKSIGGSGALVRGIRKDDLLKLNIVSSNIVSGKLTDFYSGEQVVIGSRLAEILGVSVGDKIKLLSPEGDITPFGVNARIKSYYVSAIFQTRITEYDNGMIYMPLRDAQMYFNFGEEVPLIELFLDNPEYVQEIRMEIEKTVKRQLIITDWRQRNQVFFSAMETERNVMFIILTLIVFVASLNIISGLTMIVTDKGKDIAILRTMGATAASIMRIFFITGATIGVIGTCVGVLMGILISYNIEKIRQFLSWLFGTVMFDPEVYFLSALPVKISWIETLLVIVMTLVLSFLASIFPAWKASHLDPVQALRYE